MASNLHKLTWLPFFFFFFISICSSELCHPNDKKALLNIKQAFNNPYILSSWDLQTDCCDWYSVECDQTTHRVISLTINADDRLTGQIPPEVGNLPFLQTLMFHKLPNLTGPIQPTIAKLRNLKFFWINWTNISGSIPEFLGSLTNLNHLSLSFNKLTGTIPTSLTQLPNLRALQLDRNNLTGPIPDLKGQISYLYLSHNRFSGKIPASLSRLMNLILVDVYRNKLEGDISMFFGANKTIQILGVSRNLLMFNLSEVSFPQSLTSLDLNHNKLFGGLPLAMKELNFQYLNVSYNRLCGQIPVGGALQEFDLYSYFHNKCLCGAPLGRCKS